MHLCRNGTFGQAFAARATFNLSWFEHSGDSSRSRLDFVLSHASFDSVNVMSIRSDGRVGIFTNPGNVFK